MVEDPKRLCLWHGIVDAIGPNSRLAFGTIVRWGYSTTDVPVVNLARGLIDPQRLAAGKNSRPSKRPVVLPYSEHASHHPPRDPRLPSDLRQGLLGRVQSLDLRFRQRFRANPEGTTLAAGYWE